MPRTKQWSDDHWPRLMLNFPGSTSGQIIACMKALAKKMDIDCVLQAIARLEGRKYEANLLWPVMTKACGDVIRDRANALGSTGRAPAAVSEQFRDR